MLLHQLRQDDVFRDFEFKVLVSCPHHDLGAGGLFQLDFKKNTRTKVFNGDCRGLFPVRDGWIIATNSHGIIRLDHHFQLKQKNPLRSKDFHGIAPWNKDIFLAVETAENKVGFYKLNSLERLGELQFHPARHDVMHMNDIWVENNRLYISMFHLKDNWRKKPQTPSGCISEISLRGVDPMRQNQVRLVSPPLISDLFMPHSVMKHDGQFVFCDSMRFQVVFNNDRSISFPGYTRGLAFFTPFLLVGQSRMRHLSRVSTSDSNCSLDGGIHLYHLKKRVSRLIPLPAGQIYQIVSF